MNRHRLLTMMLLVVPLAAAGCAEETTRILDPEPSNDPAARDLSDESPPRANAGPLLATYGRRVG
jgi:hypothetical protein